MFGMLCPYRPSSSGSCVAHTNDGLASALARGRGGRRRPKLAETRPPAQLLYGEREKAVRQIADISVPRSTVYGHLDRAKTLPRQPEKSVVTNP